MEQPQPARPSLLRRLRASAIQVRIRYSILEMLSAVTTHVMARCRDCCCAGFMTFVGLTMGVSVMLFSFRTSLVLSLRGALETVASRSGESTRNRMNVGESRRTKEP